MQLILNNSSADKAALAKAVALQPDIQSIEPGQALTQKAFQKLARTVKIKTSAFKAGTTGTQSQLQQPAKATDTSEDLDAIRKRKRDEAIVSMANQAEYDSKVSALEALIQGNEEELRDLEDAQSDEEKEAEEKKIRTEIKKFKKQLKRLRLEMIGLPSAEED